MKSLVDVPPDVLRIIASDLPFRSIISFCLSNPYVHKSIYFSRPFWVQMASKRLPWHSVWINESSIVNAKHLLYLRDHPSINWDGKPDQENYILLNRAIKHDFRDIVGYITPLLNHSSRIVLTTRQVGKYRRIQFLETFVVTAERCGIGRDEVISNLITGFIAGNHLDLFHQFYNENIPYFLIIYEAIEQHCHYIFDYLFHRVDVNHGRMLFRKAIMADDVYVFNRLFELINYQGEAEEDPYNAGSHLGLASSRNDEIFERILSFATPTQVSNLFVDLTLNNRFERVKRLLPLINDADVLERARLHAYDIDVVRLLLPGSTPDQRERMIHNIREEQIYNYESVIEYIRSYRD